MTIIDQIIQSPRMPEFVRELNEILAAERARREEFYAWLPDDKKAEFINGRIVVHSPVRLEHESASTRLARLMGVYVDKHGLGYVGHEKLLVCLTRNDYEPDICFWNTDKARHFVKGQMKFPAPDLAVEILSPSTEHVDRNIKFEDYAVHGVEEYWVIDADVQIVEQYVLSKGVFELKAKASAGTISSRAIKGFAPSVRAIFDAQENLRAMESILRA